MQLGPGWSLAVGAGYLAVNVSLGNLLEPRLMGQSLGLSTLMVFLSLLAWGGIWGPAGMLLAVPMTVILKLVLEVDEFYILHQVVDFCVRELRLAGRRDDAESLAELLFATYDFVAGLHYVLAVDLGVLIFEFRLLELDAPDRVLPAAAVAGVRGRRVVAGALGLLLLRVEGRPVLGREETFLDQ